jgi:8-oxo-dGTP pyrophosphatase MutT (NUDIX family)
MIWKPDVTVAAVVERGGAFLLVEEETDQGLMFNQPAGHLERGESLAAAVRRETLEESGWDFTPEHLVGIYQWCHSERDLTYLRFAFTGRLGRHHDNRLLDTGIVRTLWMTAEEIRASQARHRSPLVMKCVEDYLAGRRAPLDMLVHCH